MGAIAGWVDFSQNLREKSEIVERMSSSLRHRGEKGNEFYAPECALISRQSVKGSLRAKQPMRKFFGGEEYTIVFDGAIFNVKELRKMLEGKGYPFFGDSETEVLINLYIEYGAKCLELLNGVFSFAIWKAREKELFIARDRIGVKPLYYRITHSGIIFASEVKALFQNPLCPAEVGQEGLQQIFLLGPGKPHGETMYSGIKELCHAEYAILDKNGARFKKYWTIQARENTQSLEENIITARELITDSINIQSKFDAPFACFLSGGLDSSIISFVLSNKAKCAQQSLQTLSIDYENNATHFFKNDFQPTQDSEYIEIMTKLLHSNHKTVELKTQDICHALNAAALSRDMPGMADVDSSMLLACLEARKQFEVCFSGECADELFGGYPWYHREDLLNTDTFPWAKSLDFRKQIVSKNINLGDMDSFVKEHYLSTLKKVQKLETDSAIDKRIREMFILNFEWFMQNLLDRAERLAARADLEVRVPLCDYRLVEFAYNLPWTIKSINGREKGLLRESFRGILPDKIIERKKSPFPKTFDPRFVEFVKNGFKQLLHDKNSIVHTLLDKKYCSELLNKNVYQNDPWYGQLMRLPQFFAYWIQLDTIFKTHSIKLT